MNARNETFGPVAGIVVAGLVALVAMTAPRARPLPVNLPTATPARVAAIVNSPTASPLPSPTLILSAVEKPPSPTAPPTAVSEPTATPLAPEQWQTWPIIPALSENVRAIYERGLALGNNPRAFSKVGDCSGTPNWFLGDFDRGPRFYALGEHENLSPVLGVFAGSFERASLAAHPGFSAGSLFDTLWVNPQQCNKGEGPLACEYRQHRPSVAFIMLGTNDAYHQETFESSMRQIIEYSLERGVIPVLTTKADNLEGDNSLNPVIARLAAEYDVPLWNYWRVAQTLPNFGLQEDGAHLTWGPNRFDDPATMQRGWPNRNLTALQMLEAILLLVKQ